MIYINGQKSLGKVNILVDGYQNGRNDEWSLIWDSLQNGGKRTNYDYFCNLASFNVDSFKPKYDMKPTSAMSMFRTRNMKEDLSELLSNLGVKIDFRNCTNVTYLFYDSPFIRVPEINTTSANSLFYLFKLSQIETIDKLILKSDGSQTLTGVLSDMKKLENVIVEGTIGQNGFDVGASTLLSGASIESIINALSSTTSGLTVTISKTAKENAFTDEEWQTLIATKPNWTIALV